MHHAAPEALSSLSRHCEKPVRGRITCSPRPRNPVRRLRLALFGSVRFRASGAVCASRSLLRDVPRGPIGTKTGPDVLCREDARGPFSAPAANQGGPRGTPFVSEVFVTDHGSQVAGHRPRAMLAPTSCLSTFEPSTLDCVFQPKSFTIRTCAKMRLQVLCNPLLQIHWT